MDILRQILDNPNNSKFIEWMDLGSSFVVYDYRELDKFFQTYKMKWKSIDEFSVWCTELGFTRAWYGEWEYTCHIPSHLSSYFHNSKRKRMDEDDERSRKRRKITEVDISNKVEETNTTVHTLLQKVGEMITLLEKINSRMENVLNKEVPAQPLKRQNAFIGTPPTTFSFDPAPPTTFVFKPTSAFPSPKN